MVLGLCITGSISVTTLILVNNPESNIFGNLPLKVEKLLTLTGDVKTIFKLQDVNLSLNNFWNFFRIWNKVLAKNGNVTKAFILGTFRAITLGVYNSLSPDLIREPNCVVFLGVLFVVWWVGGWYS